MYLARLEIENFRIFGSKADNAHLSLDLSPGLNLLVGENDSGKTCVVDAVRFVLGTNPSEYNPLAEEDFHCSNGVRATTLSITAEIEGLSEAEAAPFLEHLEVVGEGNAATYRLRVVLTASRREVEGQGSRRSPVEWVVRAGPGEDAPRFEGAARELLRAAYLKPLRNAIGELAAKKGSRLSQILQSYPQLQGQGVNDFNADDPNCKPVTLKGIMRQAEHSIGKSPAIINAATRLNDSYLKPFSIGPNPLRGQIGIPAQELRQLLERLELTLIDQEPGSTRGLGHHNVLFMAAELLAVERDTDPCLPLVLIEEPEAHLHPQLQLRLVDFFRNETTERTGGAKLQVIMTSHSPNIASKVGLADVTMMSGGKAFSLRPSLTKLDASDYAFLERFLDVTRCELLFARGLLIVEGAGEELLLPTLAALIGCPLTANGVSVINVGHRGLFRYAKIFQRADGTTVPVKVACLADRDVPPAAAQPLLKPDRKTEGTLTAPQLAAIVTKLQSGDQGAVKTFVSPIWTLEYDLARHGLAKEVHIAVSLAAAAKSKDRALTATERTAVKLAAETEHAGWVTQNRTPEQIAIDVYTPLAKKDASKAETAQHLATLLGQLDATGKAGLLARLPQYVVQAIEYATGQTAVAPPVPAAAGVGGADSAAT